MANDPYFDPRESVVRLLREYREHKRLIVAVDFDDTVYDFHKAGHDYPKVIDLLARCQALDFYIVLFTGTAPSEWEKQKDYLWSEGITVHSVNKNPIPLPFGNDGKIYYNILLDDRAGLGQAQLILKTVLDQIEKESE